MFALGGDDVLKTLLSESGLRDVKTKTVRSPLSLASAADTLEMMQQAFGAYRAVVADLDEPGRADAWSEVGTYLKQFEGGDGSKTELEFIIGPGARG